MGLIEFPLPHPQNHGSGQNITYFFFVDGRGDVEFHTRKY